MNADADIVLQYITYRVHLVRVRCRGPNLNRLSSTLVQLNQNKIVSSAAGNTTANGSAKQARAPCRQLSARGERGTRW